VLLLLRGIIKFDVPKRFSLVDVRLHPWFTRKNKFIDETSRLINVVDLATDMFEQLHVSFDTDLIVSI
jgi:hypothetical protein